MPNLTYTLFAADLAIPIVLLAGVLWSIWVPDKRIWPPPRRRSWQWVLTWACFSAVCGLNVALLFLDWNAWRFPSSLRFAAGIPVVLLGGLIAVWGVITLGWKNSAGLKDGFVGWTLPVHPEPTVPGRRHDLRRCEPDRELFVPVGHSRAAQLRIRPRTDRRGTLVGATVRTGVPQVLTSHAAILAPVAQRPDVIAEFL